MFDSQIVMSVFKDHKIFLNQVLTFIPETLLSYLSTTSQSIQLDFFYNKYQIESEPKRQSKLPKELVKKIISHNLISIEN